MTIENSCNEEESCLSHTFSCNDESSACETSSNESTSSPSQVDKKTLVLKTSKGVSAESGHWIRVNTRLISKVSPDAASDWKQGWNPSYITPEGFEVERTPNDVILDHRWESQCFKRNPGYSASFDNWALGLAIDNPRKEDECRATREGKCNRLWMNIMSSKSPLASIHSIGVRQRLSL